MRLFIACNFSPEVIAGVNQAIVAARPSLPKASWLEPEALHLTLAFLGEQEERIINPLESALEEHLAAIPAVTARLTTPGFFPDNRRPRVGWLAVEPKFEILNLAAAVHRALRQIGVDIDVKPFVPHMTLVRIKERWCGKDVDRFLRAFDALETPPSIFENITLYSSRLSPAGAVHTELTKVRLKSASSL